MSFRKITPICSENHKKHMNTIREQNENSSKLYSKVVHCKYYKNQVGS